MSGPSTVPSAIFAGRYAIERELGRGATAVVYLAWDRDGKRRVAIKVLRQELAESVAADRFLKEIRLTQQLHHPQIVPLLDSGNQEGQLYFVLPVMEGGTLRSRLQRESQLPLADVVAITRSIAVALDYAHERGLVHRDVKPENILFTSNQACLSDFGIARALERAIDDTTTTSASIVRGTPLYMSPEQASGGSRLDGRSDIYSLGCVVYEMISGMQPFVGPSAEAVYAQKLLHPPRQLDVYRRGVSNAVDAPLARVLSVTPADRYQTATEFADALEAAAKAPIAIARNRTWWFRLAAISIAIALVGWAAASLLRHSAPDNTAVASTAVIPEGDRRRIAVLYFDDRSPETLPSYIADGITEGLIDQLTSVRALHVISPTGVRGYRGAVPPLDSLRRALKVGTIVSGTVARSGATVRAIVRLTDVATGVDLSTATIETQWTERFVLEDRIADQVGFALRRSIGAEIDMHQRRAGTKSVEAWEAAQRANDAVRREADLVVSVNGESKRLYREADSLYLRAVELDPGWSYAKIRRGILALRLWFHPDPPISWEDRNVAADLPAPARRSLWNAKAISLANEVLRSDPRSAEALSLRGAARHGLMLATPHGDTLAPVIEADLRAALAIRPDDASAWITLSLLQSNQAKFLDAAAAAEHAFEADPFFQQRQVIYTAFWAYLWSERFAEAGRWCKMGVTHYPTAPLFAECELTLVGWTGRSAADAAVAWRMIDGIERSSVADPLRQTWGYRRLLVAAVLARAGMADSARHLLDRVRATPVEVRGSTTLPEAYVYLLLGQRDSAIARLDTLIRATPQRRAFFLNYPWMRGLRGDPRVERLAR